MTQTFSDITTHLVRSCEVDLGTEAPDKSLVNVAVVKQDSDQQMKVWDNDKWTSLVFDLKKRHSW